MRISDDNMKFVIIIIGIILVYYLVIRKLGTDVKGTVIDVFGKSETEKKQEQQQQKEAQSYAKRFLDAEIALKPAFDSIGKLVNRNGKTTYKTDTMLSKVDKIKQALDKTFKMNVDASQVKTVIHEMNTLGDIYRLIGLYGEYKGKTLVSKIHEMLPQSDMIATSINDLNEILSNKGINFKF